MNTNDCIEQKGIVEEITGNKIKVRMKLMSACENCKTKSICNLLDIQDNSIDVANKSDDISVGDEVNIRITKSHGYKALFFGYVLPFILVFVFLVIFTGFGLHEVLTGLISLSVLAVYYFILYHFRDSIRRAFIFTLRKAGAV